MAQVAALSNTAALLIGLIGCAVVLAIGLTLHPRRRALCRSLRGGLPTLLLGLLFGLALLALAVLGLSQLDVNKQLTAGELITGIAGLLTFLGTAVLAGFTWWLAQSTKASVDEGKRMAEATEELARSTQASVNEAKRVGDATEQSVEQAKLAVRNEDMPWIIPSEVDTDSPLVDQHIAQIPRSMQGLTSGREGKRILVMRLWNIGRGPGIVRDVKLSLDGTDVLPPTLPDQPVTSTGTFDAHWEEVTLPSDWETRVLEGTVTIIYQHADGSRWKTTSTVHLRNERLAVFSYPRSDASPDEIRDKTPST